MEDPERSEVEEIYGHICDFRNAILATTQDGTVEMDSRSGGPARNPVRDDGGLEEGRGSEEWKIVMIYTHIYVCGGVCVYIYSHAYILEIEGIMDRKDLAHKPDDSG